MPPIVSMLNLEDTGSSPIVITTEMLQKMFTQIFTNVNTRIAQRIVSTIGDTSDNDHVPSALAVLNMFKALKPSMQCQTVTGDIESVVEEPDSQTIYLQKDSADDQTWTIYLYINEQFVAIGDSNVDLVNYWSKNASDINELRIKILDSVGMASIKTEIDYENILRKADESSKQVVLSWINDAKTTILGWVDEVGYLKETDFATKFGEQLTSNKTTIEGWADAKATAAAEKAKSEVLEEVESDYVKNEGLSETVATELAKILGDGSDEDESGLTEAISGMIDEKLSTSKTEILGEVEKDYLKTAQFATKLTENKTTVDSWIDAKVNPAIAALDDKFVKSEDFVTKFNQQLTASQTTVEGWIETKVTAAQNSILGTIAETYLKTADFNEKFTAQLTASKTTVDGWIDAKLTDNNSTLKSEILEAVEEDYLKTENFGTQFASAYTPKETEMKQYVDNKVSTAKGEIETSLEDYVKTEDLSDAIQEVLGGGDDDGSLADTINEMIDDKVGTAKSDVLNTVESTYLKKEDLNSSLTVITEEQISAAISAAMSATDPFATVED